VHPHPSRRSWLRAIDAPNAQAIHEHFYASSDPLLTPAAIDSALPAVRGQQAGQGSRQGDRPEAARRDDQAAVHEDVARIIEIYHRNNRYQVEVTPNAIARGGGRVDLVFETEKAAKTERRSIRSTPLPA
jgi:hypothetical protein